MSLRSLRIGLNVEGNSDADFLQPLLRRMAEKLSPPETAISMVSIGRRTRAAAEVAAAFCEAFNEGAIDLACIHRDGESGRRYGSVRDGILDICRSAETCCRLNAVRCVPLVPLRMIEAWALADQAALRDAFGVTRLPAGWPERLENAEDIADPKQELRELGLAIRRRRRRVQPLSVLGEAVSFDALLRCRSFRCAWDAFGEACAATTRR